MRFLALPFRPLHGPLLRLPVPVVLLLAALFACTGPGLSSSVSACKS